MSVRTVARFALVGWLVVSIAAPAAAQNPPDVRVRVLKTRTGSFMLGAFVTDAPVERAPMPREAGPHGEVRFGLHFGGSQLVQVEYRHKPHASKPVAPMPREKGSLQIEFGIELGCGQIQVHGPGRMVLPAAALPAPATGEFRLFSDEVVPGTVVGRPAARVVTSGCQAGGFCVPLNGPAEAPRVISRQGLFIMGPHGQPVAIGRSLHAELPNPMLALGACRRDDNGTWWVEVIRVPQPKFDAPAAPRPAR